MNPRTKRMPLLFFMLRHSVTIHCRWLYSLFVAIDTNFRLKLKSRGVKDPELGSGLAYFVNTTKFEAHLKDRAEEEDVSEFSASFRSKG